MHSLMQLLPSAIQAVATDRGIDTAIMFAVEFLAKPAVVLVGLPNMLQFAGNEFQDDDVIEIANDRNVIGKNVLRVAEIYERGQDVFAFGRGQPPFVVGKHLQHRFEFRQSRGDEVGQRRTLANFVDYAADGIDDFRFVRAGYDIARSLERVAKEAQITIAEFERQS